MELLSRARAICGGLFAAQRVRNRRLSKPNSVVIGTTDAVGGRPPQHHNLQKDGTGQPRPIGSRIRLLAE